MRRSATAIVLILGLGAGIRLAAQDNTPAVNPRSSLGERFSRLRSTLNTPAQPGAASADADPAARVRYPSTGSPASSERAPAGSAPAYPSTDASYGYPSTGGPATPAPRTPAAVNAAPRAAEGSAPTPRVPAAPEAGGARLPFMPKDNESTAAPSSPREPSGPTAPARNVYGTPRTNDSPQQEGPSVGAPRVPTPPADTYREPAAPAAPASNAPFGAVPPGSDPLTAEGRLLFSKQSPVLTFETLGPKRTVLHKESVYRVAVRNSGGMPARDITVTAKVPDWIEVVQAESGPAGFVSRPQDKTDVLHWTLKKLDPQQAEELTLRIVPRKGLPFEMGLQVAQAPLLGQANIEVAEPKLVMAISGPQEVAYNKPELFRLVISNPGSADAEKVELKLMPSNAGETAPPPHPLGTIAAGEKKVVELELIARQGGTLKIDAQVSGFGGLKAEAREAVLIRKPETKLAIKGPKFRYTGSAASYDIAVTNPGNAVAQNLQLVTLVPPGAKFLGCSHRGQYDAERARVTWRLSSIEPGSEQSVSCKFELHEPGQTRIQAACTADDDVKDSVAVVTQIEAVADLALSVSDPPGPVPCGEEIAYEIKVTNRGTRRAEQLQIAASLSAGLKALPPAEGTNYRINPGQVVFDVLDGLAPGQTINYKVRASAVSGGSHVFRVELKCASLETTIVEEESTRFYSDDDGRPSETAQPAAKPAPRAAAEPSEPAEAAVKPGPIRWTR